MNQTLAALVPVETIPRVLEHTTHRASSSPAIRELSYALTPSGKLKPSSRRTRFIYVDIPSLEAIAAPSDFAIVSVVDCDDPGRI